MKIQVNDNKFQILKSRRQKTNKNACLLVNDSWQACQKKDLSNMNYKIKLSAYDYNINSLLRKDVIGHHEFR